MIHTETIIKKVVLYCLSLTECLTVDADVIFPDSTGNSSESIVFSSPEPKAHR